MKKFSYLLAVLIAAHTVGSTAVALNKGTVRALANTVANQVKKGTKTTRSWVSKHKVGIGVAVATAATLAALHNHATVGTYMPNFVKNGKLEGFADTLIGGYDTSCDWLAAKSPIVWRSTLDSTNKVLDARNQELTGVKAELAAKAQETFKARQETFKARQETFNALNEAFDARNEAATCKLEKNDAAKLHKAALSFCESEAQKELASAAVACESKINKTANGLAEFFEKQSDLRIAEANTQCALDKQAAIKAAVVKANTQCQAGYEVEFDRMKAGLASRLASRCDDRVALANLLNNESVAIASMAAAPSTVVEPIVVSAGTPVIEAVPVTNAVISAVAPVASTCSSSFVAPEVCTNNPNVMPYQAPKSNLSTQYLKMLSDNTPADTSVAVRTVLPPAAAPAVNPKVCPSGYVNSSVMYPGTCKAPVPTELGLTNNSNGSCAA